MVLLCRYAGCDFLLFCLSIKENLQIQIGRTEKFESTVKKSHKNEKSEGLDSTTIFQNERIIDDFDPTDPFSLASRMNQHLHEYPESKFD